MKRIALIAVVMLFAASLRGEVVAHAPRLGTLVASANAIRIIGRDGATLRRAPGVARPSFAVVSEDGTKAAVVDSLDNTLAILDVARGETTRHDVGETPIAAVFVNDDLYVLCRDGRKLTRIGNKNSSEVEVASDSAFLRTRNGRLYVYSRAEGTLAEYAPDLRLQRTASAGGSASDLEVDGRHAYLLFPRSSELVAVSLETFAVVDRTEVGAVPIDLALERLTIAVADPSSKRVWRIARSESPARAFARAFVRGFLGLSSARASSVEVPSGVDRLWVAGAKSFGYDSANRTLYRLEGKKARRIAHDVELREIAETAAGVAIWSDDRLVYFE